MQKKIVIGSDHAGYALKEQIKNHLKFAGVEILDVGCDSPESCSYPDIAHELCSKSKAVHTPPAF